MRARSSTTGRPNGQGQPLSFAIAGSSDREGRVSSLLNFTSNTVERDGAAQLVSAGEVPKRSNGADCKSVGLAFGGSNPPLSTTSRASLDRTASFSQRAEGERR